MEGICGGWGGGGGGWRLVCTALWVGMSPVRDDMMKGGEGWCHSNDVINTFYTYS